MQVDCSHYRPATPDSSLASSLDHATSTIDDLTLALTNFSRVPSPEPQQISCCCGSEDCEATKAWLSLKSKLEGRLLLSAEVGSALLQRHEAYVRRHEPSGCTLRRTTQDSMGEADTSHAEVEARVGELLKENAALEKRLTRALLHNEVAEASNKTMLQELEEARSTVSKLNAHHARTIGLDTRLCVVLQENDDIRQERDSQMQQARLAEARLTALKDHADQLQAEVRRLQDVLGIGRSQRIESSDSLLQDVRSRIRDLQITHVANSAAEENPEVIKVIESLVADNEMLKADNMELQKILTELREDLQALQTEVGERNIASPVRVATPSQHSQVSNRPSSFVRDSLLSSTKRPPSVEPRSHRVFEPWTPDTSHRPLSPAEPSSVSATKYIDSVHHTRYSSHISLDMDNELEFNQGLLRPNQATKTVQTDGFLGLHSIYHAAASSTGQPSISPHDGHSDSSSLLDDPGSPMSSILERMHSLLHRMTQADALTLTNRLKRQHLRGADVKHLSRTTVSNILSDVSHLRARYRAWLEDDKITTLCTRKDLRGLFKLFKEVLEEMGQLRVTLNDVILEPNIAVKVSETALDPAKAEAMDKERTVNGIGAGASWMAPFSKLFSSAHDTSSLTTTMQTLPRPISGGDGNTRVSRPVPKLGPALAASATTVNVEFSGIGTGKSVTSVFSAHPDNEGIHDHTHLSNLRSVLQSSGTTANVRSVMGIFAGAPHPDDTPDPWVILPRAPRRVQSTFLAAESAETRIATTSRSAVRKRPLSSRDVEAILDAASVSTRSIEDLEADDTPGPLVKRTLRRRGLSDTSIHSTFMNHGGGKHESVTRPVDLVGPWLESTSVLRSLSRTVRNFKQVASNTISGVAHISTTVPPTVNSIPETSDSLLP